jgi:hypothetical protein
MALDGMGSYKIAKKLNELGIKTPRNGKMWKCIKHTRHASQ